MSSQQTRTSADDDWYKERRQEVEALFVDSKLVPDSNETHTSPTGRYRLIMRDYDNGNYSHGLVFAADKLIAEVKRDYGIFHFGWAEDHSNGHDYLLCGEALYGQTVIELDTGRRVDFISEDGRDESSFICTTYFPSPDRKLIVVEGCYWACPFELIFCRFDDPMKLPWPEVDRVYASGETQGWTDEGFVYESSELVRLADSKEYNQLSKSEQHDVLQRRNEIGGKRIRRQLRKFDGSKVLVDERTVPNSTPD